MGTAPADITRLLRAWSEGDEAALASLTKRVHAELHRIAHRHMRNGRNAHTLQTTALVNEAYSRLADAATTQWRDRAQFFALAARIMRGILVDAARARDAAKRGGKVRHADLDGAVSAADASDGTVLALDAALGAFSHVAPRQAKVVELRYFGGSSEEEIAAVPEVSPRTVRRDRDTARAWLRRELNSP